MKRFLLLILPLLLTACDSTDTGCGEDADCPPARAVVFVGNQGNFSDGDGSVTIYDPEAERTTEPITGLGSIVQSVAVHGGRLYVTANTGGRVEVYDATSSSYERIGRIEVENPRYVAFDGSRGRLWVTSQLYDRPSEVAVVDAETYEVLETVEVGGLAGGIVAIGERVYVATGAFGASQEVVVLDAETNAVVERIDVGCVSPRSLVLDADAEVWVFCNGAAAFGDDPETDGEVVVLEAATGEVVTRIEIDGRIDTAGPGQDAFGAGARGVFAVRDQDTVLRFDPLSNTLAETIPVAGDPIGGVAYDAFYDRLYLGRPDATNLYTARGSVTIHESDGEQVGQFEAGALPAALALLQ